MADYREISQEYAHGAIKGVILLNGGAAVALLSQLASLLTDHASIVGAVRWAMLFWAIGTTLGGGAWLLGFLSARYVDKSEREKELEACYLKISNIFMYVGVLFIFSSLVFFLAGCLRLAFSV